LENLTALLGILTAITLGAISPGPSFVLVARTAMVASRRGGLAAAFGMGIGAAIFALAALLGLQGVLLAFPTLYVVLRVLGSLYLAYLGTRLWRAAQHGVAAPTAGGGPISTRHFLLGLTTQLTNPVTALVLASIFAAFMPKNMTTGLQMLLVGMVFMIDAGWYTIVALVLSSERPRNAYLRYQGWIDRAAGGIMVAMALKLLYVAFAALFPT